MKVRKLLAMLLVLSMVLSITLPTAVLAAEGDGADVTVTETTESTGTESTDSTEPGTTESGTTETGDGNVTVPDESENPAPAPSESTDPTPVPSESTDPTPVPSESTDPTPTPSESTDPTPVPSESTDPTPTPSESTDPTPTPSESTDPAPAPSESTDPTPVPSESTDPTPVPSESTVPAPTETVEIPEATVPGAALCEHGNDPTICPECNPDLYCEHGVLLTEECAQCIAAQQAHEAAMAVAKSVYEKIMAAKTLAEYAAAKVVDPMYQSSIDALLAEYVATLTADEQAAYAAQIEMLEALVPPVLSFETVEEIYAAIMAAETKADYDAILAAISDEQKAELDAYVLTLTEEEQAAYYTRSQVLSVLTDVYVALIASTTLEEFNGVLATFNSAETEIFQQLLSQEQTDAITMRLEELLTAEDSFAQPVNFTNAAPLVESSSSPILQNNGRTTFAATQTYAPMMLMASAPMTLSSPANTGDDGTAADPDGNGLALGKSVTGNETDGYTVKLEAYASGTVSSDENSKPLDIVLVLDVSGSMDYCIQCGNSETSCSCYRQVDSVGHNEVCYGHIYHSGWIGGGYWSYDRLYWCDQCEAWLTTNRDHFDWRGRVQHDNSDRYTGDLYVKEFQSRIDSLKTAVNGFIDSVAESSPDSNIAIVKFAGTKMTYDPDNQRSDGVGDNTYTSGGNTYNYSQVVKELTKVNETGASALKSAVLDLDAGGATQINFGLQHADTILTNARTAGDYDRKQVVIAFTDGEPTSGSSFETSVANSAIDSANSMKDAGVTVYSIGVFSGADGSDPSNLPDYTNENNAGWGGLSDQEKEDNANRFMHLISSNYPGATKMNDTGSIAADLGDKSYFLSAGDSDSLNDIFETISEEIATPKLTLGTDTILQDEVTQYFEIPAGAQITVQRSAKQADGSWSTPETITATATTSGNTVQVTGIDYSKYFVSDNPRKNPDNPNATTSDFYGYKYIVTFPIEVRDGFWGGNQVPTNVAENSAVYSKGTKVEQFAQEPTVDVSLNIPAFTAKDLNIYYGSSLPTVDSEYYNAITVPNDWRTDYVNRTIVYSVDTSDTKNTEDSNFTVTATLSPKYEGTCSSVSDDATGNVYVFTPIITLGDLNTYLTEEPSYPVTATNVTWQHKTVTGTIYGTEPDLSLTCTPDSDNNYTSDILTDYYVDVTQVTSRSTVFPMTGDYAVQFEHSTSCLTGCTFDSTKGQFMVHVFQPVIEFQDIKTYLGNTMDGDDYTASNPTVAEVWKWGDVKSTDVTMQGTKPAADDFGYTYDNGASKVATEDYHVSVQVELNGQELEKGTHYTVSHKACDPVNCGFESTSGDFMVHVFKPTITFQDSTIYKGETGELNFKTENYVKTVWKHEKFSGALTGNAPDLTFTYDQGIDKSGYSKDTPVNVTEVKNGSNELDLDDVTFDWQRGGCDCTVDQTGNAEFIVHVKTCTLTVTKSFDGGYYDKNDTFLFTVTGPDGYEATFTLGTGDGELENEVKLTGLAVGTYTVTEDDGWSWRYTASGDGPATLSKENPDDQITITNTLEDDQWLTYDGSKVNSFKLTPAESLVSRVMTALVPEKPKLPGDQDADNEERS